MLIAQISDLHLLPGGAPWRGKIDTAGMAAAAISRINALPQQPDAVVLSGDLADKGSAETYATLRKILQPLRAPVFLMPGNHDDRASLRAGFPQQNFSGTGLCCQRVELPEGDLLLLDSAVASRSHGKIDDAQIDWLDTHCRPAVPSLLFLHHPPFATGIGGMDGIGLHHSERLAECLRPRKNIAGIFCGHVHRPVFTQWAGRPVAIAPSTAHQMALDLDGPSNGLRYTLEPPAMLLIRWRPGIDEAPITHVLPIMPTPAIDYDS